MKLTARAKPQGRQPASGSQAGTPTRLVKATRPKAIATAVAKAPAKVAADPEAAKTAATKPAAPKPAAPKPVAPKPVAPKPVAKAAAAATPPTKPGPVPAVEASTSGLAEDRAPTPTPPPAKPEHQKPDAALATQSSPVPPVGPMPMRRDAHPSIPQRQPSKQMEFKAGDHVVYPTHGVGTVQGIETMSAAGHSLQVIVVTFDENRMTLRVPVGKAASSGLRKLAGPESMKEALDTLKGRARIKRTMWSRRAQEYEAKINSGDPIAIAEVVRDLHRNAGQPDQSFSERQIYEQALDRLAAELAAIDRTDKAQATVKLLDHLKTA
jgi:CarD family transcriptional regulator